MKNIIFDFGAVLIDWNPNKVYSSHFKTDEEMERFYEETQIQFLNAKMLR